MIGLLNYMQGLQQRRMANPMQQGLLGAMSNQGKLIQPQPMMPMDNGAAQALQGVQQNAVIMPAKKKEGGGGGSMEKAMTLLKLMGMGG